MVNRDRTTGSTWLRLIILGLLVVGGLAAQSVSFGSFNWTGSPSNPTLVGGYMDIGASADAQAAVAGPGTVTISWEAYSGAGAFYIQTAPGDLVPLAQGGGTFTMSVTGGDLVLLHMGRQLHHHGNFYRDPTTGLAASGHRGWNNYGNFYRDPTAGLVITQANFKAVPFDAGFGVPLCAAFGFAIPAVKRLRKRSSLLA
jgi:hypothetical protein